MLIQKLKRIIERATSKEQQMKCCSLLLFKLPQLNPAHDDTIKAAFLI
ncbi:hypothetical protein VHE8714_02352 [Vibrio splendidus]|nr:hypothetical protein VHE8714_02352 [Vibrio splendidus]